MQPQEADIRRRSYLIWEREGRPSGRDWQHWFEAEAELAKEEGATTAPQPATPQAAPADAASTEAAPARRPRKKGSATAAARKPRQR